MGTGSGSNVIGTVNVTAGEASKQLAVNVTMSGVRVWAVRMYIAKMFICIARTICPLAVRVVSNGDGIEEWAWRAARHMRNVDGTTAFQWGIDAAQLLAELRKSDPNTYLLRVLKPVTGAELPSERTLRGVSVPGQPEPAHGAADASEFESWQSPFTGLGDLVDLHHDAESADMNAARMGDRERPERLAEPGNTLPHYCVLYDATYQLLQPRLLRGDFGLRWSATQWPCLEGGFDAWKVAFPTVADRDRFWHVVEQLAVESAEPERRIEPATDGWEIHGKCGCVWNGAVAGLKCPTHGVAGESAA